MNTQTKATPVNILDEDFNPDLLHPVDLTDIIVDAWDYYQTLPKFTKLKRQYRDKYNSLVDILEQRRGFKQFNYL